MMVQQKKIIQTGVIILLSVLYLNLNAKTHTFLKNSSIGLSYNNGIYFANRSFINNRYIDYTTKPSVYYGFGLNYQYQFKPHFSISLGYYANFIRINDKFNFDVIQFDKEILNNRFIVYNNIDGRVELDEISNIDNKFNIEIISSILTKKNLSLESVSGISFLYTRYSYVNSGFFEGINDSESLHFMNIEIEYNRYRKISYAIVAGLDFKYAFKNAGALRVKVLFNGNLSKSKDEGNITLFPKSSIETSSPYIVNHSHIDFSLEYILPHLVKRKHKR